MVFVNEVSFESIINIIAIILYVVFKSLGVDNVKFVCMHACSATKSCEVFGICEVVFEPHL